MRKINCKKFPTNRIRTSDLEITASLYSLPLCQLSYSRVEGIRFSKFKNKLSWETNRFCPWYQIYQFYKRKGFRIPENYTEMHDYNRKYRLNLTGNDEIWLRINFKFTIIRWWDSEGHHFDDFPDNNLCHRKRTTKNQKRNYRRSEKGSISNIRIEFHFFFIWEIKGGTRSPGGPWIPGWHS